MMPRLRPGGWGTRRKTSAHHGSIPPARCASKSFFPCSNGIQLPAVDHGDRAGHFRDSRQRVEAISEQPAHGQPWVTARAGFDERREGSLQEEPAGWRPVFGEIGGEPGRDTAAERLAAEDDSVRGNLEGLSVRTSTLCGRRWPVPLPRVSRSFRRSRGSRRSGRLHRPCGSGRSAGAGCCGARRFR